MKQYEMVFTAELTLFCNEDELAEGVIPEQLSDAKIKEFADKVADNTGCDHCSITKYQCFTHEVNE